MSALLAFKETAAVTMNHLSGLAPAARLSGFFVAGFFAGFERASLEAVDPGKKYPLSIFYPNSLAALDTASSCEANVFAFF